MNVLVIGCGKGGSKLAEALDRRGHDVAVVDQNPDNFSNLSDDFDGVVVSGMPMDMTVLKNAGVEYCDAVAVSTADDNLNITISQIVKKFFNVKNVVTRIMDPARERAFRDFGMKTVCSTNLTCDAIYNTLLQNEFESQLSVQNGTLSIFTKAIKYSMIGKFVNDLPTTSKELILGVIRKDEGIILNSKDSNIQIHEDDRLIYTSLSEV